MAEELSDNRFKSEVMRLLTTVITKVDSLDEKVDSLDEKVDENTREVKSLQSEVRVLSGQFQDVASVVIKDTQRLNGLEERVDILEQKPH